MPEFLKLIATGFWQTALEMAPYLMFGFFVAGLLSVLLPRQSVERHLGGRGVWPVIKASLFGIPLPLCSCSVIPVTTSLFRHGAGRGAAISFLLSTPQTGVDSILVTFSLLGPLFAFFRPVAAFITGVVGGTFVNVFDRAPHISQNGQQVCKDECCNPESGGNKLVKGLRYGFISLPRDIAGPLIVGLIIAAFITALVPDDFFAEKLPSGLPAMLIMMVLGIPVYVCATASVPIAAAMMLKGLSPGAALVFLVTGPATNAAAVVTIWNILGKKTAVIYFLTVVTCALAGGMLLDMLASGKTPSAVLHHGWMMPRIIQYISAIILFIVLGFAIIHRSKSGENEIT